MTTHIARSGVATFAVIMISVALPAYGMSPEWWCTHHAYYDIDQYQRAKALGIPGLSPPVWSYDFAYHYQLCLKNNDDGSYNANELLREDVIKKFCIANYGYYGIPPDLTRWDQAAKDAPFQCVLGIYPLIGARPFRIQLPPPPSAAPTQPQAHPRK